jgi:4,5-dihydroxyphthalate decarboxylase
MLPWLARHLEETTSVLRTRYWDYGLEANRRVLETFSRYSHEQGLAAGPRTAEEIVLAQRATHSCSDRRPRSGSCSDRMVRLLPD